MSGKEIIFWWVISILSYFAGIGLTMNIARRWWDWGHDYDWQWLALFFFWWAILVGLLTWRLSGAKPRR